MALLFHRCWSVARLKTVACFSTGVTALTPTFITPVNCFGRLEIQSRADVTIKPLLTGKNEIHFSLDRAGGLADVTESGGDVTLVTDREDEKWLIHAPPSVDIVGALVKSGSVHVEAMENRRVQLSVEDGECCVRDLRSGVVDLVSSGRGEVRCEGSIQASTYLTSRASGAVHVDKVLGDTFTCHIGGGGVTGRAVYATRSEVTSEWSHITLNNLHSEDAAVWCRGEGDVVVNSFSGERCEVYAQRGNLTCHLSSPGTKEVQLTCERGHVTLTVSPHVHPLLVVEPGARVRDEVVRRDEGEVRDERAKCTVKVKCPFGMVNVKEKDWIASLNLK